MSSGGGGISETFSGIANSIAKPATNLAKGLGVKGVAADVFGGLFTSGGNPIFGLMAIDRERKIREARKQAEGDESSRQRFNNDIFNQVQALGGDLAQKQNEGLDPEAFKFSGNDPRQQQLEQLVSAFGARQSQIKQSKFQPGSVQTRLTLMG